MVRAHIDNGKRTLCTDLFCVDDDGRAALSMARASARAAVQRALSATPGAVFAAGVLLAVVALCVCACICVLCAGDAWVVCAWLSIRWRLSSTRALRLARGGDVQHEDGASDASLEEEEEYVKVRRGDGIVEIIRS